MASEMHIRDYCENDYGEICSLINNELGYSSIDILDLKEIITSMKKDEKYKTLVVLLNNKTVGFINFVHVLNFCTVGGYIRILTLAVLKEYQRNGIGSALLQRVEEYAIYKGLNDIRLESGLWRLDSHIFYERNGYKKYTYGFIKNI
jgi:GNAT superfamily N-acetyltransferase